MFHCLFNKRYRNMLLACLLAPVLSVKAQVIKGIITGKDGQLPGATITVKNTGRTAASDLAGSFTLNAQATGKITILVNYVGYDTRQLELDVQKGTNDAGTIELQPAQGRLANVMIKGTMAPSQAKAYSIKKNSVAIMEVIAADAIGKLPDRNAAEAVQRVQGVAVSRYHGEADQATVRGTPFAWTSTLFNGTHLPAGNPQGTRASLLDVVPSEMIQYVQVTKAITPDMEGDAIGGAINFITRTAPTKRMLNVSAAGGYNNFSKDGTYNASIVYGDRFFHNKLGIIIAGALWDRKWGTDSYEVAYNTGLSNPVQQKSISTLDLKRYMGTRQTYGSNIGLEYRFNASNKVFARGMINKFNDIRPVYESWYDFNNSRYQYTYRYSYYQTKLNGGEVGGEHQLGSQLKLDWAVSEHTSSYYLRTPPTNGNKGLPIAYFRQKLTSGFGGLASDGKKYLAMDSPDGKGDDAMSIQAHPNNPAELMDPTKLTLQQLVIAALDNSDKDKVVQVNLKHTVNSRFSLKYGAKYRNKQRDGINQASYVYLPGAALGIPNSPALLQLSSLQRTSFPNRGSFFSELGNAYNSAIVDPLTKQQLFDLYDTAFLRKNGFGNYSPASNATLIYHGHENVTAGYVMADYDVTDKLHITGGVRNEYTAFELNSSTLTTSGAGTRVSPISVNKQYNSLLPMLHAKYSLNDQLNIRAAFTRTFIRPNFTDLNPGESSDLTKSPITITKGNPDLKPTYSNNYDLMGEYYFTNIGLLSGGVFYKDLSNVIFTDQSAAVDNTGATVLTSQPKNLQKASLLGFEAGINKRFDFLKGFWSGFGIEFNYTHIHSSTHVPRVVGGKTVIDETSLPNQSKHLFNAILFYERKGVMVRLAGNYRGKSVETLSQQLGPQLYTWADNYFTIDASASVAVGKRIKLFAELNNLNNAPLKYYLGDPHRPTQVEWYSQRGQAGIRWDIIK
ncbi:TonB-dependent receptor [Deminuibacter soli]|uniref:TonB-dependent receptor n=1 Tax=Deminuibacter soli TaxID=2291815 RepID=A0A3E1NDW8_9BACT|nr:TonB-dependent receptor [Deminuibacter soli]RFM26150.1 TonB-dependent receptor [Deminuibacter soli]